MTKRINFRLNDIAYLDLLKQAGEKDLSTWCREKLLAEGVTASAVVERLVAIQEQMAEIELKRQASEAQLNSSISSIAAALKVIEARMLAEATPRVDTSIRVSKEIEELSKSFKQAMRIQGIQIANIAAALN